MALRDKYIRLADYVDASIQMRVRELLRDVAYTDDLKAGVVSLDHALLTNLDYASSGHTGFLAQGNVNMDTDPSGGTLALEYGGTNADMSGAYPASKLIIRNGWESFFGFLDPTDYGLTGDGGLLRASAGGSFSFENFPIITAWGGTGADLSATGPGIVWQPTLGGALEVVPGIIINTDDNIITASAAAGFIGLHATGPSGELEILAGSSEGAGANGPGASFYAGTGDIDYVGGHLYLRGGLGQGASGTSGNLYLYPGEVIDGAAYGNVYIASNGGKVSLGQSSAPTALLHFAAGTAAAGTAPIKLTEGPAGGLTVKEDGVIDYHDDHFWGTVGTNEIQLDNTAATEIVVAQEMADTSNFVVFVDGTGTQTPRCSPSLVIGGLMFDAASAGLSITDPASSRGPLPDCGLYVFRTVGSDGAAYGARIFSDVSSTDGTNGSMGIETSTRTSGTGAAVSVIGNFAEGILAGSRTQSASYGTYALYGQPETQGTASVAGLYGLYTHPIVGATTTVTNSYGVYLDNPSGAPVNNYGLYIANQTAGSGTNYSIYSAGGGAYFAGNITAASFIGPATAVTVANEATDTTCFPLFVTAATGDLGPKTNAGLTFNSSTGALGATYLTPTNALQLLYGGTQANLSGTGPGYLKQATSGAAVTVGYPTLGELNGYHVIYVDKSGTGDYTTIKAACDYVATQTRSNSSKWVIYVLGTGTYYYQESDFTIPTYTAVIGVGRGAMWDINEGQIFIASFTTTAGTFITMQDYSSLEGVAVAQAGTLTGARTIIKTTNNRAQLLDVTIGNYAGGSTPTVVSLDCETSFITMARNIFFDNEASSYTNTTTIYVGTGAIELGYSYLRHDPAKTGGVGISIQGSSLGVITHCRFGGSAGTGYTTDIAVGASASCYINNTVVKNTSGNVIQYDRWFPTEVAYREAPAATDTPLIVKGATSQSADLSQWMNQSGNVLASVSSGGGAVFNEQGNDSDTRFEGDTDANLVFVDASADKVGIGTNAPGTKLEVSGTAKATEMQVGTDYVLHAASATKTTAGAPYTNDGYITVTINGTSVKLMTTAG